MPQIPQRLRRAWNRSIGWVRTPVPASWEVEGDDYPTDHIWRPRHWRARRRQPERQTSLEVGVVGLVGLYNYLSNRVLPDWAYAPANLSFSAFLVWVARNAGVTWEEMGLRPDRIRNGVRVGLILMGSVAVVIVAGAAIPATRSYFMDDRIIDATAGEALYQTFVRIPLGTAVFEELVFRGVLLGLFMRYMSPLGAATASSLLFGLWHLLPTLDALETNPAGDLATGPFAVGVAVVGGVVATTAAGYGFSWIRFRANSLVAPVLTHVATNSFSYAAAWVIVRVGG